MEQSGKESFLMFFMDIEDSKNHLPLWLNLEVLILCERYQGDLHHDIDQKLQIE